MIRRTESAGQRNDKVWRVGILGTGWAAHEHVLALRSIPGVQVAAVASADHARAARFAAEHGIPTAVSPHEKLCEDPKIDIVHICTRTAHHAHASTIAMLSGKHVIAEKPLASSFAESAELLRLAESAPQLVAACNFNYRAYPAVQRARQMIERGELGRILLVRGAYIQDWLLYPTDSNWRLDPDQGGLAGAFGDIGSHLFDLIEHITGEQCTQVTATLASAVRDRHRAETFRGVRPLDDCGAATFVMSGGALGSLAVSQVSAGRKNQLWLELNGTKGSIAWHQEESDRLWIGRRDEPSMTLERDVDWHPDDPLPSGHPFGWRDALHRNIAAFYHRVNDHDADPPVPFATFSDGHRSMQIVEAAVRSSRLKRPIALPQAETDLATLTIGSAINLEMPDGSIGEML